MTKDMFSIHPTEENVRKKYLQLSHQIMEALFEGKPFNEHSIDQAELPKVSFFYQEEGFFVIQSASIFSESSFRFVHDFLYSEISKSSELEMESITLLPFKFFELANTKYLVTEIVISLNNFQEKDSLHNVIKGIQTQMRMGLSSNFYARMVLEMKGNSFGGKNVYIQQRIVQYIHKFPLVYDYDLINFMNDFFKEVKEEFIKNRSVNDVSKIIINLYFLSKKIGQKRKNRAGLFRDIRVRSHFVFKEELFGRKKVLGVIIGLSHLSEHERLGEENILKACKKIIHKIFISEMSFIKMIGKELNNHLVYVELYKKDETITHKEREKISSNLNKYIENHIQKFTPKIFMPQNTEEVMKYTVALSKELKEKSDYPQVAVLFDSQTNDHLNFTAIILKIKEERRGIFEIFDGSDNKKYSYKINHVRSLGEFKHGIEISYKMKSAFFMREDYSVDIYKARSRVIHDLQERLGVIRDYNGGMLEKQSDLISECQGVLRKKGVKNSILIENFFYSIQPFEMRAILDVNDIVKLFMKFYDLFTYKTSKSLVLDEKKMEIVFITRVKSELKKENFIKEVRDLQISCGDLLFFIIQIQGYYYLGANIFSEDSDERKNFMEKMSLCFKP